MSGIESTQASIDEHALGLPGFWRLMAGELRVFAAEKQERQRMANNVPRSAKCALFAHPERPFQRDPEPVGVRFNSIAQ